MGKTRNGICDESNKKIFNMMAVPKGVKALLR